MKLLDVNLLVFAYNASAPEHARASAWLEDVLWADEPVATSWTNVLAFLRLTTSKVFPKPLTPADATAVVDAWLTEAGLSIVEPTERHWAVLRGLVDETGVRGNHTYDAHLAALAMEHGATLCTDDVDFRRFKGLRLELPLRKQR
ncbi:MAG: PIN domain-containing protein [Archangiaceae bacterium]|nr:PIN domain-containing protein [Archangiaceae bacterium]